MGLGQEFCHQFDVSLALAGEMEKTDDLGALIKPGFQRREIMNQTGLIVSTLREEFGLVFTNYDYWYSPPIEHPLNTGDLAISAATLTEADVGMQQIKILATSSTEFSVIGSIDGTIATGQAFLSGYNANGITILAADITGTPDIGDTVYISGYNVDPMLVTICAKLTAFELIESLMRNQALEYDLKLLQTGKRYWQKRLEDIRDGRAGLAGRQYVDVGQVLSVPTWEINEYGEDSSKYRDVYDPGSGSIDG